MALVWHFSMVYIVVNGCLVSLGVNVEICYTSLRCSWKHDAFYMLIYSERTSRWKWRTWQSASGRCWWLRLAWRNIAVTRRCTLTCSTVWPSHTPARQNSARRGLNQWLVIMRSMEAILKWVLHCFYHRRFIVEWWTVGLWNIAL